MIKIERINKEDVQAVEFVDEKKDHREVLGKDLFSEQYANIFFCARKKSGKSCAIAHIIDKCANSETRIIAFVSTLNRDPTWRAIEKSCAKRNIPFTGYTSLKDELTKTDILADIVMTLEESTGEEKAEERHEIGTRSVAYMNEWSSLHEPKPRCMALLNVLDDPRTNPQKKKKEKYKAPKLIFIFDDLSGELLSPSVTQLLKKNRHFKCKTLISSQYFNDLSLPARKQLDYVLLYRGLAQSIDKMRDIYRNLDLSVPFETFVQVYRYCTAKPKKKEGQDAKEWARKNYSFMYIDVVNSEFRKNFSHRIVLPAEDDEAEEERVL